MRGAIALAALLSSFAGVVLASRAIQGFGQATFIWFLFAIACGLLLPIREDETIITAARRALVPVLFQAVAIALLLFVHFEFARLDYEHRGGETITMFGRTFPHEILSEYFWIVCLFFAVLVAAGIAGIKGRKGTDLFFLFFRPLFFPVPFSLDCEKRT